MPKRYDPRVNAVRDLAELASWQEGHSEPVTEPDLPIVDSHHHLWRRVPPAVYLPEDLMRDAEGHNVLATVFIECRTNYRQDGPDEYRSLGETEFVLDAVTSAPADPKTVVAAGIVAYADLRRGDGVRPVLEAQAETARGRLRGIRHQMRWDADGIGLFGRDDPPGLALDPRFREGIAALSAFGLSFDAWVFHPQLGEVADFARAFPNLPIIVNHVGGPLGCGRYAGRREEVFAASRQGIAELARCPNVLMKVGGLGMLYCGFPFHERGLPPTSRELADAWRPYVMKCIDRFGPGRCMFESNFPVAKQSCSYRLLWNAFKRLCSGMSDAEKLDLFSRTATRAYRLEQQTCQTNHVRPRESLRTSS
jgi:L-fuconolactonase